jgi:hypothetical protein
MMQGHQEVFVCQFQGLISEDLTGRQRWFLKRKRWVRYRGGKIAGVITR